MSVTDTILKSCAGVKVQTVESTNWRHEKTYNDIFVKVGDIVVPDNIFIEITGTATKGTIAKVVAVEVETYGEAYPSSKNDTPNQLVTYGATFIYTVDGRKPKGRINSTHARALVGMQQTKYVRDVNTHEKVVVKNPVNKFKQEMQKGDWVIGVKPGKYLGIGRITRWTNHNVWAVTGDDLTDKSKEFKFDSITETFTMPDDAHVKLLTMAVLKGWRGG